MNASQFWIRWVQIFALLTLSIAAFAQETTPPANAPKDYVIGAEDGLSIYVRDAKEFTGEFVVRQDGKINMPVVGEVQASGLTIEQLEKSLAKLLAKELRNPQVTINVGKMRMSRIYILGQVAKPGVYDTKPDWRLTEVIAAAGGLSAPPERVKAVISRKGQNLQIISLKDIFILGNNAANVVVLPEDNITIQGDATMRVTVTGEVAKPGLVNILDGEGTVQAVAGAGGQGLAAALSKAVVIRNGKQYPVDLYLAIVKGDMSHNFPLMDGDSLVIPRATERIAVYGMVNTSGMQPMPDGEVVTVSDALSKAGGPSAKAKLDGITISRLVDNKTQDRKTITLNFKKDSKAAEFLLQDRDVIYIPQSGKATGGEISQALGLLLWPLRLFGF